MNGEVCCILGVCCPPAAQYEALETAIVKDLKCSPEDARKHAAWTLKHFDLAPKGKLAPLVDAVVEMAKHAK